MTRRAFTLIEILVVIGIIVLLIAILVPVINRARKGATRTQVASELQSVTAALEAFKLDHGDYPRVSAEVGFAVLGRSLIGPYGNANDENASGFPPPVDPQDPPAHTSIEYQVGDAVRAGSTTTDPTWVALRTVTGGTLARNQDWSDLDANDGLDGAGGRDAQGKKFGPYLNADQFKMRGLAILDRTGGPILYFPARPGKLNVTVSTTEIPSPFVDRLARPAAGAIPEPVATWDAGDNFEQFRHLPGDTDAVALARIRGMLGDMDNNGRSDAGETAAAQSGFILWAAGLDGLFGPQVEGAAPTRQEIDKCDDVLSWK